MSLCDQWQFNDDNYKMIFKYVAKKKKKKRKIMIDYGNPSETHYRLSELFHANEMFHVYNTFLTFKITSIQTKNIMRNSFEFLRHDTRKINEFKW